LVVLIGFSEFTHILAGWYTYNTWTKLYKW